MIASTPRSALSRAARRLEEAGIPEPSATAETLMAELLGTGRAGLALHRQPLTGEQEGIYERWISERLTRKPVQRILGYSYFRYLKLKLDESVMIPRPDTESVVDAALERIDALGGERVVLDLGTGSGAIAASIALERPACGVHASDFSEKALSVARHNAKEAGVKVYFHRSDVAEGLEELRGGVDLLVSNPPYVPTADIPSLMQEVREWDPHGALDGGPDGLRFYRRTLAEAKPLLKRGSEVVFEVGDGRAEEVVELGEDADFKPLGSRKDLGGVERAVILHWDP